MSDSPIYPHDPIDEIGHDVFMVRGCIKMNALMTITRNMAFVRHDGELTLIDPIRLSATEEKRLDELGTVKRIIRLGPGHGVDDPYYIERYGAELWAPGASNSFPEPKPSLVFDETTPLPFPDAQFFCMEGLKQPEGAILLKQGAQREQGLLITCDSIQHYGDYSYNSLVARLMMPFIGFSKTTIVGPLWLKAMTPEGGDLESEFRRLLELDFDQLLTAHGTFLETGAHESCERAVDKTYPR